MRSRLRSLRAVDLPALVALAASCALPAACGGGDSPLGAAGGSAGMSSGSAVVGGPCSASAPCRAGLICATGLCAPGGSTQLGGKCVISGECDEGQCVQGACRDAGVGEQGDSCRSDVDCQSGFRCQVVGLFAQCQLQGVGDLGTSCEANADCFSGLFCIDETCERPTLGAPLGGTTFAGVSCPSLETATPRAYFEVPGADGADEADFFRLPFPNDARMGKDGRLDLSGFPSPGRGALGFDPVLRYVESIEANERGWGTDPSVIFRFSTALAEESLDATTVHVVDITPGDPQFGLKSSASWYYSRTRTPYVCANWLAVRRPLGEPMLPGHVYAVYLSSGVLAASAEPVTAAPNLRALLEDATPGDAQLAAAHARYAPLRDYLAAEAIDRDSVLAASVITPGPVREPMTLLAGAVAASEPPRAYDFVKCAAGVTSPCPDGVGEGRSCGVPAEGFDEYHGLVELPIFQRGTPPYLLSADGGDIAFDGPVRSEAVCLSLTVPRGTTPAAGWPLIVYAHGTGGSFRDHVRPEVAGALADAPLPDGRSVQFAVLGIDQVEHGPRRGSSSQDPNNLFFNIANPNAARGNALQGAADQLSLARLASDLDVSVGSERIQIDPNRLFFFGHSQGATQGSLMLAFSDSYKAAVLSGNGGSLRESLLDKKSPLDVSAALPFVLSDPTLANPDAARAHPVLSVLQHWVDSADPLNFASALALTPVAPHAARHVFQPYGLADTYSPPATMQAFILAGGFALVENSGFTPDPVGALTALPAPLSGNLAGVTLGARQYRPAAGIDGHFVTFLDPQANADVVRFFALAADGAVPAIGE